MTAHAKRPYHCGRCGEGLSFHPNITHAGCVRLRARTELIAAGAPARAVTMAAGAHLRRRALSSFVRHLDAHPNWMTSGDCAPPSVVRLLHAVKRQSARVVLPRCARCGAVQPREAPSYLAGDGVYLCSAACYRRAVRRPCSRCGTLRRLEPDSPSMLCRPCWRTEHALTDACTQCGRLVRSAIATRAGKLCQRCYQPPRRTCTRCGRMSAIHARRGGDRCGRCDLRPARMCPTCGTTRAMATRALCTVCYAQPRACARCGRRAQHNGSVCRGCVFIAELDRLFATAAEPQQWQRVRALLLKRRHIWQSNVLQTLFWRTLCALVRGEVPMQHATLDALPAAKIRYLRAMLVTAGLLPERNEERERFERWCARLLDLAPSADATLLRAYAATLLQRRDDHGIGYETARPAFHVARRFLQHLARREATLKTARNVDLDAFLARTAPSARARLMTFLRWSRVQHALRLRRRPAWQARDLALDQVTRDEFLARLTTDLTLSARDRFVATLVLFGVSVTTIARLRCGAVWIHQGIVVLSIGRTPLPLDDVLGRLATQLCGAAADAGANASAWLLPGGAMASHITPTALYYRLQRLGIGVREAHAAARRHAIDCGLSQRTFADLIGRGPRYSERSAHTLGRARAMLLAAELTPATARAERDGTPSLRSDRFTGSDANACRQ